jgi:hypothetical protein
MCCFNKVNLSAILLVHKRVVLRTCSIFLLGFEQIAVVFLSLFTSNSYLLEQFDEKGVY